MICLANWAFEADCAGLPFDYQVESQDQYYFESVYSDYASSQALLDEAAA